MSIAENIKKLRKEKGLTQKQLGSLCTPKISESTIRKYELGILNPKIDTLVKLKTALKCKVADLVDDKNKEIYSEFDDKFNPFISIDDGSLSLHTDGNEEFTLLLSYRTLNKKGREKALDQIEMLTKIPEYQINVTEVFAGTQSAADLLEDSIDQDPEEE